MNANMKRLLIFSLVPITVWGIGSTFTKQKIDRIGVNTESQITMEDTTRFSSGTASTVPYLDASKDLVSSSVTPAELGYLSGVSSSIQTQIDGKQNPVSGTTNEIDIAADIVGLADNPILPGIEGVTIPSGATGDRPVSPNVGQFRWNTDNTEAEIYDGTQWGSVGGGAGGSRLNLLDDPSFEKGVANGSCTGCTASQDTTDYLATPNNEASLKMAFSAASGNYTWTESTSAQYSNVAGVVSAWIKTSASDCHFDELVDGVQSQTVAIGSSDEWKQYIINGTTGTTSYGWRVRCDTAITDDVFVDETFAGAAEPDTFDINNITGWEKYTPTTAGFGTISSDDVFYRIVGDTLEVRGAFRAGTTTAVNATLYLPTGYTINVNKLKASDNRNPLGYAYRQTAGVYTSSDAQYAMVFSDASTTDRVFFTKETFPSQTGVTPSTGSGWLSANDGVLLKFSVPVNGPSTQKVVAASCEGLECVQSLSARFNTAGTLEDENVEWVQSVTKTSTGNYDITFKAGLFSEIPAYQVTSFESGSGGLSSYVRAISTSGMTVAFGQDGVAFADKSFSITLDRVGSDAKQFDSRFIPVVDDEIVIVRGEGNSGASITADVTDLDFTEVEDNNSLWSGTAFVPDVTGDYIISGSTNATGSHAGTMQLFENGSLYKLIATNNITAAIKTFSGVIRLTAGNSYTIRSSVSMTLSNSTSNHWIQIHRLKDSKKAFIGNLTPKEFVQTPSANKPVMHSCDVDLNSGTPANGSGLCSLWVDSYTDNGAGDVTINLISGKFSAEPTCTFSSNTNDQLINFALVSKSTSAIRIRVRQNTTLTDYDFGIICHGVQ